MRNITLVLMTICTAAVLVPLEASGAPAGDKLPFPRRKAKAVIIPLDMSGGRPVVEARLGNHGPFRFILDTGASLSVMTPALFARMGLPVPETSIMGSADPELTLFPRIRIGKLRLDSLQVAVLDFLLPDEALGVLSVKLFTEYLTTFDYPNSTLRLEQAHLELGGDGHVISYAAEPIVTIDALVDGENVAMHLDTGSPATITVSDRTAERLNFLHGLEYSGTARIPGREVVLRKGVLQGQVSIAGNIVTNPELHVGTFFGDAGNIGYGYLKDKILTLDQQRGLLRLVPGGGE